MFLMYACTSIYALVEGEHRRWLVCPCVTCWILAVSTLFVWQAVKLWEHGAELGTTKQPYKVLRGIMGKQRYGEWNKLMAHVEKERQQRSLPTVEAAAAVLDVEREDQQLSLSAYVRKHTRPGTRKAASANGATAADAAAAELTVPL